jgi:hypothetical protein
MVRCCELGSCGVSAPSARRSPFGEQRRTSPARRGGNSSGHSTPVKDRHVVEPASVEGGTDDTALPASLRDQLRPIAAGDQQPLASDGDAPLVALGVHGVDRVPTHHDVVEVLAPSWYAPVVQREDAVHLERVEDTTDDALSFRTSPPGHLALARRQGAGENEQETHDDAEVAGLHGPFEEDVEPDPDDDRDHDEQWQPLPAFFLPPIPEPLVLTLRGLARHP